ncbi:MAG TPA: hypothetical protein VHD90_08290 [Phototrophicaceae bacterium]|nr:hypothetical protein [Phototrophicaceae bacterium]
MPSRRDTLLYWSIFAAGCAIALCVWSRSPGVPVDDEIAHLVIARNAWHYPELILHIWGRVGNTLIYMIPALFGLIGARLGALLMSAATVLVTTATARQLGVRRLYLIPLFLWFQPWFPSYGFTAITEIPFLLIMALGMYGFVSKRYALLALCIGWLPLIRHEGVLLTGIVFLYLLWKHQWRAALLAFAPLVVYNVVFELALRMPLADSPLGVYFNSQPTTAYGSGPWLAYIPYLIWETGYPICFWALIGIYVVIRRRIRGTEYLLLYLSYLVIHSILYHFGLFGSGGYGFFILPLAPAGALLAALGVEALLELVSRAFPRAPARARRSIPIIAATAILIPVLIMIQYVTPWKLDPTQSAVIEAVAWAQAREIAPTAVIAPNIWFTFAYAYAYPWQPGDIWSACRDLNSAAAGTILIWDAHYASDCGYTPTPISPQWKEVARFGYNQVVILKKL